MGRKWAWMLAEIKYRKSQVVSVRMTCCYCSHQIMHSVHDLGRPLVPCLCSSQGVRRQYRLITIETSVGYTKSLPVMIGACCWNVPFWGVGQKPPVRSVAFLVHAWRWKGAWRDVWWLSAVLWGKGALFLVPWIRLPLERRGKAGALWTTGQPTSDQ